MTRSSHPKKAPEAGIAFKETLCQQLIDLKLPRSRPIQFWIYDEARYGLAPSVGHTVKGSDLPGRKALPMGIRLRSLASRWWRLRVSAESAVSKEADTCFLNQIARATPLPSM
ncbi:MAG: hypothetical protein ACK5NG_10445 [Chthoniobacterales bacterium]